MLYKKHPHIRIRKRAAFSAGVGPGVTLGVELGFGTPLFADVCLRNQTGGKDGGRIWVVEWGGGCQRVAGGRTRENLMGNRGATVMDIKY